MKSSDEALKNLLASARSQPEALPEPCESESLPPGLSTRIAARWAAPPSSAQVWERVTAAGFALALIACVSPTLLKPKPTAQEPDVMLSLFYARPAPPADDFPF